MPLLSSGIELSIFSGETEEELPALKIYTTSLDQVDIVNATIPSVEGETFEIHVNNTIRKPVRYEVTMDGRMMDAALVTSRSEVDIDGVYSQEGVRPFMFSKLQVKDDDEADGDVLPTVDLSSIGTIEIKFWRVKITGKTKKKQTDGTYLSEVKASLDPISEKAKKIGHHGVSLGPTVAVPAAETEETVFHEAIDPLSKPHAVFRYHYKPQDVLEREGITVHADTNKRPLSDDGDAEVKPDVQTEASQAFNSRKKARHS